MAQLLPTFSWKLDLDYEANTLGHGEMNDTASEWLEYKLVVFPLMMLVTLCGLVGNGVVFWLLCFHVRSCPYATYILNLAVADIINLSCIAVILLEEVLLLYHEVTLHVAIFLEPVSYFSDTVGLCLLTAISAESSLCILFPNCCCHRPKHTSAVVSVLSWGLALSLHMVNEICDYWENGLACDSFHEGFVIFHTLIFLLMCMSSLALTIHSLRCFQRCSLARIYHVVRIMIITFLLWGLPLVVIMFLPEQEYLTLTFDLLLLLSSMVSTAHPVVYILTGCFRRKRRKESLKIILQRALMSDMET
ncbi:mas-related G-protein coupled receptor MRG [Tupaia chinensis]|uniref:Mas-related G-protein coupled receptor MRG n=1 Tax=Tupaia chinensis TaxID=246437 RepID=L9LAG9_TUPCH|nr:mas-related G-protein coupled receptor MRG [Tupaia chinensis]ELW71941.1 Mas-related G-protein coupled receptor MRG [Tupaia chinensis]